MRGPLFEFKVTDWESYGASMKTFREEHPELKEVNAYPKEEGDWIGPIAQTLLTVLLFVGLWMLLMRKMGGPGGGHGARAGRTGAVGEPGRGRAVGPPARPDRGAQHR